MRSSDYYNGGHFMNIGATIKKYRKERDITQEKFAEYLNVLPQAVSRWETGAAYPDISTIPAIATFLGISADILFGIEESKREEQIQAYLKEYKRLQATGESDKRFELSKAAKISFPGDFRVIRNYAYDLASSPYQGLDGNCVISEEKLKKCFDEVLDLCRIVQEDCTDDEIRNSMISLQLMICRTIGDKSSLEKAAELANRLPYAAKQSELALIYDYESDEEIIFHQNYTQELITSLWREIRTIVYSSCTAKKKISFCKKALALYRLMYDNEDYGCEGQTLAQIYEYLAKLYMELKDYDSALDSLEKFVQYDLAGSSAFRNGFAHTSPLFDRLTIEKNNFVTDYPGTPESRILHYLNRPIYDPIRDTERFQNIIKKLK